MPPPSSSGVPAGGPVRLRVAVYDGAIAVLALAVVVASLVDWVQHGVPRVQPVNVLGLLSVPVLVRYSMTISVDAYANVLGLPVAVLFASGFDEPTHIFPIWGVLIWGSYVLLKGGFVLGTQRSAQEIVAGWCLVQVAPHIDFGLRPFDRTAIALVAYLGVLGLIFALRRILLSDGRVGEPLDLRSTLIAVGTLYYTAVFIACLRRSYTDPGPATTAEVAVLGLALVVVAVVAFTRVQDLARGVDVLASAAGELPWPSDTNDAKARTLARRAVRSQSAHLVPRRGGSGTISSPVDTFRFLVLNRVTGDMGFSATDQRLLEAVTAMARVSRVVTGREEGFRRRITTDALTGLWNHAMFLELAGQISAERDPGESLAVIFLDLDRFKAINEDLGHFDADLVLREMGTRLREVEGDGSVASRFGGDEFAVLLRHVDEAHVEGQVRALIGRLTTPIPVAGRLLRVHVSAGIGVSHSDADHIDDAIRTAERKMREAKRMGRTTADAVDEREMLRSAIDDDEVTVAYQPIVRAATGELWGCEALVRASNAELGVVPPLTLVSSAARENFLDALTQRIGTQALEGMARLTERTGAEQLMLTVNVEFEQFRIGNPVYAALASVVRGSSTRLMLELSEREFVGWTSEHTVLARRLRDAGIGLAIDDFGAGFATFSLLKQWQWDLVKIDKSLVTADDEASRRLFANVTRTLRDLEFPTLAEGIETTEQLETARWAGVDLVQGHLASKPLTIDQLVDLVGPGGSDLAEAFGQPRTFDRRASSSGSVQWPPRDRLV